MKKVDKDLNKFKKMNKSKKNADVIAFYRMKEILKTRYFKKFLKFMDGQTVSEHGFYEDDFMRWIQEKEVID